MRLVQVRNENTRCVAIVEEPRLRLLGDCESVYALVEEALAADLSLSALAQRKVTQELLDYDPIYRGASPWRLLAPVDHPREPARCLVSGTGLTHLGSARERQAMHAKDEDLTDSMKMFRRGIEGGRPPAGQIGTAPEWFYKGTGTILRAHGEALETPAHAEDGGEEGEIAGIYFADAAGVPRRVGMAAGNEFSDHKFEKKNYLNLASSKIRTCAIGPELVLDADFQSVPGEVVIERDASVLWRKQIRTGEAEMCHSLRNIEHHHFKFDTHRRPGDLHVHFLGADCLSFGDGIELRDGDVMQVRFEGFGRALRNPVRVERGAAKLVNVASIG
ncbi:MAG TPA: AraD1 family protein [Candidatus Acidoferrales bacterium]|nr:AraD1 family protein [Candidatus Acidoferrales bacterium]